MKSLGGEREKKKEAIAVINEKIDKEEKKMKRDLSWKVGVYQFTFVVLDSLPMIL